MAKASTGASNERNKNQAIAGRIAFLRNAKFETQGFKSNEPVPSVSEARKMHAYNVRLINSQAPQPRRTV
jgi:hypothetical protein